MRQVQKRTCCIVILLALLTGLLPVRAVGTGTPGLGAQILEEAGCYYGDSSACVMTRDQAAAFAQILRAQYNELSEYYQQWASEMGADLPFGCYAALFDTGTGSPALFFIGGAEWTTPREEGGAYSGSLTNSLDCSIWQYTGGRVVEAENAGGGWSVFSDHLISSVGGDVVTYTLYRFDQGDIVGAGPGGSAVQEYEQYYINGASTSQENYDAWMKQWADWDQSLCGFQYGGGVEGRYWGVYPINQVISVLEGYAALEQPQGVLSTAQLLDAMGYIGDPSTCAMTAQQAAAFAQALRTAHSESMAEEWPSIQQANALVANDAAALFPVGEGAVALAYCGGGNRMPSTAWMENYIWEYVQGEATLFAPSWTEETGAFVVYPDRLVLGCWNNSASYQVYPFAGGRIAAAPAHEAGCTTDMYTVEGADASQAEWESWLARWNPDYDWWEPGDETSSLCGALRGMTGSAWHWGMTPVTAVIAALDAYAQQSQSPAYDLPKLEAGGADYQAVTDAALAQTDGEVTGVYRLAEGIYYVLVETGGGLAAAVVRGIREGGSALWRVDERQDQPLDPDALRALSNQLQTTPNLTLDYTRLGGSPTLEGIEGYLRECLDNMEGLTPNDPAKSALAVFLEEAVSALASGVVSGSDNRLSLGADGVSALAREADGARAALLGVLQEAGVTLNKPVTPVIRLLWQDPDLSQPCQVTLEEGLAGGLGSAALRLLLGDGQHYVQISPDQLQTISRRLTTLSIQLQRQSEGVYALRFLDESGAVVEQLPASVTVALPATGPLNTIMVSYAGGSDNWGGQYDPGAGTIAFETSYSGQYEVLENNVEIDDIGHLSPELQQAITFLVSRGYLELDGASFRPDDPLSRYAFTQSLVGMFFALDRELTTTFTDVPAESGYYPYVASAQVKGIVTGVSETAFSGESNLTVEQMLTLAARTLTDYKGYTPPSDGETYLSSFEDGAQISGWAREPMALAVREELVDLGGTLNPTAPVSRAQAADILYRLFLRLYEVPPAVLDLPGAQEAGNVPSGMPGWLPIALGVFGGAALIGGGGAAAVMLKKRRHP